jgi:hypothetical protein
MAGKAIEGCINRVADGTRFSPDISEAARSELSAFRELLEAIREEKPMLGGRVGRAVKALDGRG